MTSSATCPISWVHPGCDVYTIAGTSATFVTHAWSVGHGHSISQLSNTKSDDQNHPFRYSDKIVYYEDMVIIV